jgi:hypothetical protein
MMSRPRKGLSILLIVAAMLLAFSLGTVSVTGSVPSAPEAVTLGQWAALQAANPLLLDQGQGPVGIYLPIVLR